jgi:hypothetical protein
MDPLSLLLVHNMKKLNETCYEGHDIQEQYRAAIHEFLPYVPPSCLGLAGEPSFVTTFIVNLTVTETE